MQGRLHVRRGILLILFPMVVRVLVALPSMGATAGARADAGIALMQLVVWSGLLYLVYLGFRLVRWILGFLLVVALVVGADHLLRLAASPAVFFLDVILALCMLVGGAMVFGSPAAHVFFRYQRGAEHHGASL